MGYADFFSWAPGGDTQLELKTSENTIFHEKYERYYVFLLPYGRPWIYYNN